MVVSTQAQLKNTSQINVKLIQITSFPQVRGEHLENIKTLKNLLPYQIHIGTEQNKSDRHLVDLRLDTELAALRQVFLSLSSVFASFAFFHVC